MFNQFQRFNIPMSMTPYMPINPKLAEAYVPYQQYTTSYSPEKALERGTMFPGLYSPYEVERYGGDGYDDYCR